MKKLIYLSILFLSVNVSAQIGKAQETVKWESIGKLTNPYHYVELRTGTIDGETRYHFMYQNMEYKEITDIQGFMFSGSPEDLAYLKETINKGFSLKKGDAAIMLDIGKGTIYLTKYPMGGGAIVLRYKEDYKPDSWTWLNKKQVEKLFGK